MLIRKLTTLALLTLFGWMLTSLTASSALAQDDEPAGGLEIAKLTGKLEAILGNQLKLVGEDETPSVVVIGDNTIFQYVGTAEPSVLAPGLLVRFIAELDPSGTPQAPLAELEIFRPLRGQRLSLAVRQSQTPGIYPVEEDDAAEAAANQRNPKAAPANTPPATTRQPANNPANNRAAARQTPNNLASAVKRYQIVGVVRAIQGDRMQVLAGNQPLIFQAAPEVTVTVSAGDPSYCQPGDEVIVNALKLPNGIMQAESIHVTGAKPLGAIDPKALARNQRNNPRAKLDKDEKDDPRGKLEDDKAEQAKEKR